MSKKLGGILAAVSTPFTADGAVDEAALRGHVDFLIGNGLHGLVPGGSTGEFAALTSQERKLVNKVVIEQAAGRVPLAPQTGSTSTAEAINPIQAGRRRRRRRRAAGPAVLRGADPPPGHRVLRDCR